MRIFGDLDRNEGHGSNDLSGSVLNTDVSHQRFRGYIFLTNEGKTLWLNNLNAKEDVDLYAQQYSHPYSLIVTTVSKDGVVGYLPLPTGA